ncbi:uncharacterized protein [Nicotiana tomentosiformis]|uniref:uncharacterized protein n=1 Tax=Nicotiana tomentosiformis TaxID=4098 RepID=UPI00388C3FF8
MILASAELEKQKEYRADDGDDYSVSKTFIAPDNTEITKSMIEELEQVILIEHLPDRKVYLGTGLTPKHRKKLIDFLKANADCFALSNLDMTGIPPEETTYKLSLDLKFHPVKQKRKTQSEIKHAFIKDEVSKLLKIGSIREVKYSYWLDNVVVVPKKEIN